jgi:predicted CoA-binding protein
LILAVSVAGGCSGSVQAPVYRDLADIPESVAIDIVDVFRRSEFTPEVARDAVAVGARVLWLQLGVVSEDAAKIARAGGLIVV